MIMIFYTGGQNSECNGVGFLCVSIERSKRLPSNIQTDRFYRMVMAHPVRPRAVFFSKYIPAVYPLLGTTAVIDKVTQNAYHFRGHHVKEPLRSCFHRLLRVSADFSSHRSMTGGERHMNKVDEEVLGVRGGELRSYVMWR